MRLQFLTALLCLLGAANTISLAETVVIDAAGIPHRIQDGERLEPIDSSLKEPRGKEYRFLGDVTKLAYFPKDSIINFTEIGQPYRDIVSKRVIISPHSYNITLQASSDEVSRLFSEANTQSVTFVLGWFFNEVFHVSLHQKNGRFEALRFSSKDLPESERGIEGTPAIVAYKDGKFLEVVENRQNEGIYALPFHERQMVVYRKSDENGKISALIHAAQSGNADFIEAIVEGPGIPESNDDILRDKLLRYAAESSRISTASVLIGDGADPAKIIATYEEGTEKLLSAGSAVLDAIFAGHHEILKFFLEPMDEEEKSNLKAGVHVYHSLRRGKPKVAQALVESGIEFDGDNEQAINALLNAMKMSLPIVADSILENSNIESTKAFKNRGDSLFHLAWWNPSVELLDWIKFQGADVNAVDKAGRSPLGKAIPYSSPEAVKWYLRNGAKFDFESESGATLLDLAVDNRQFSSAEVLIDAGIDINRRNSIGETPLMVALANGVSDSSIQFLEERGAKWNMKSPLLERSLIGAIKKDRSSVLQEALNQGLSREYEFSTGLPISFYAHFYEATDSIPLLQSERSALKLSPINSDDRSFELRRYNKALLSGIHRSQLGLRDFVEIRVFVDRKAKLSFSWIKDPERFDEFNEWTELVESFRFSKPKALSETTIPGQDTPSQLFMTGTSVYELARRVVYLVIHILLEIHKHLPSKNLNTRTPINIALSARNRPALARCYPQWLRTGPFLAFKANCQCLWRWPLPVQSDRKLLHVFGATSENSSKMMRPSENGEKSGRSLDKELKKVQAVK